MNNSFFIKINSLLMLKIMNIFYEYYLWILDVLWILSGKYKDKSNNKNRQ